MSRATVRRAVTPCELPSGASRLRLATVMIRSTNGRSSLALRDGGLNPLVPNERDGLIAEHRDPMLRDAAELAMCDSVTHKNPVSE